MEAADAVDALFCEAFALLEGESVPTISSQPLVAASNRRNEGSAARRKRWLDELRGEEAALCAELARLRGRGGVSSARKHALEERAKRRRAEHECQQLREALYQHTQFVCGLRGILSIDALSSLTLNLYHHLHSFTRLPSDASVRQLEYAALRREQRFSMAKKLVERETAALPVTDAHSQIIFADAPGEPSAITTKRVYALNDCDVEVVRRAACVVVHDIVARFRRYQWVGVAGESVDLEALEATGAQYTVTSIHRTQDDDTEGFSYESRSLTMHKVEDGSALVVWDFVDEDELHPSCAAIDVLRQSVGACLIRRETCPDGVARTVYREVNTRRYQYCGLTPPSPDVTRYFASKRTNLNEYEQIYHDLVLALIAREDGAVHRSSRVKCTV